MFAKVRNRFVLTLLGSTKNRQHHKAHHDSQNGCVIDDRRQGFPTSTTALQGGLDILDHRTALVAGQERRTADGTFTDDLLSDLLMAGLQQGQIQQE